MRNFKKFVRTVLIVLFAAGVLSLTGCGRSDDDSGQEDAAIPHESSETEAKNTEVQTDADTAKVQDDAQEKVWTQEMVDVNWKGKEGCHGMMRQSSVFYLIEQASDTTR